MKHRGGKKPQLPEQGWEPEVTDPVESKTPTGASPAPGQTLARNPKESPPVGREENKGWLVHFYVA